MISISRRNFCILLCMQCFLRVTDDCVTTSHRCNISVRDEARCHPRGLSLSLPHLFTIFPQNHTHHGLSLLFTIFPPNFSPNGSVSSLLEHFTETELSANQGPHNPNPTRLSQLHSGRSRSQLPRPTWDIHGIVGNLTKGS